MGQVKLYLDSFFLSGFWLHFLSLCIVRLLSYRNRQKKTVHIAGVAALCTLLDLCGILFIGNYRIFVRYLFAAGEILLAVLLAFGQEGLLPNGVSLFFVTVLFGGFFSLFARRNTGLFCLGAFLLFFVTRRLLSGIRQRKLEQGYTYEVSMRFMEEQRDGTAFLDTGNRLRLFGSSLPVIVARKGCLGDWIEKARDCCPQNYLCLPFHSVGGNGLFYGVKVECRVVSESGGLVFSGRAAVVGTDDKLFLGRKYDLLLQPEFLADGDKSVAAGKKV